MIRSFILTLAIFLQGLAPTLAHAGRRLEDVPVIQLKTEAVETRTSTGETVSVQYEYYTFVGSEEKEVRVAVARLMEAPENSRMIYVSTEEGVHAELDREVLNEKTQEVIEEASYQSQKNEDLKVTRMEVPKSLVEQLRERAGSANEFFKRHERIGLSLMRVTVNGSVTGAALILSAGLPVTAALPIALFSGLISGTFQFFNPQFQRFLNGNEARKEILLRSGTWGKIRFQVTQLSKMFLVNTGAYLMINGVSALAGVPPTGSLLAESLKVLRSSMISTMSSGVWHTTLASETRDRLLREGGNSNSPAQKKSNLAVFGVSMASAFGGILVLMGTPLGYWIMGTLGATGTIYTLRSWRKNASNTSNATLAPNFRAGGNCSQVFAM